MKIPKLFQKMNKKSIINKMINNIMSISHPKFSFSLNKWIHRDFKEKKKMKEQSNSSHRQGMHTSTVKNVLTREKPKHNISMRSLNNRWAITTTLNMTIHKSVGKDIQKALKDNPWLLQLSNWTWMLSHFTVRKKGPMA